MDRTVSHRRHRMTAMNRRDRTAEDMARQVVAEALADAGVDPADVNLVVFGNATAGRLHRPGLHPGPDLPAPFRAAQRRHRQRRQLLCRRVLGPPPGDHGHPGRHRHRAGRRASRRCGPATVPRPWPASRTASRCIDRLRMHEQLENPSGSVLMALNASWTIIHMEERDATLEQFAAAAVKARRHGALNPNAQFQSEVTMDEVLESPSIVWPLTRLMCSSFTDGAAAVVLSATPRPGAPRIRASTVRSGNGDMDYHDRLAEAAPAAWDDGRRRPRRRRRRRAARRHQPRGALRPRVARASSSRATPGPATVAGDTTIGGAGVTVNPSGGLVSPGPSPGCHRDRPGGRAGRPAPGHGPGRVRSRGPDWRWRPTPVASSAKDAALHRNPRARGGLTMS